MPLEIPELQTGSERSDVVRWLRNGIASIGPGFHFDTAPSEYVDADGTRLFSDKAAERFDQDLERAAIVLGRIYFEARCLREVWRALGVRNDPARGLLVHATD